MVSARKRPAGGKPSTGELDPAKLLECCALPWDEECLHFHRSGRRVVTSSQFQVRQPLYRSSVNRWRRFAEELQPLRQILAAPTE